MPDLHHCRVRRDGRVTWITMDRPERMNALNPAAHDELSAVFDAFQADDEAWIAVITGAGERAFCAGSDLKEMAETGIDARPPTGFAGLTHRLGLDKPVIARVNGIAVGGGFETALAADLVVAAEHARFGFAEPKIGLAALGGAGIQRLARQIPLKQAMDLLLTGRLVSAEEGARLGFVNRVVPAARLDDAVGEIVAQMLECAPLALRAAKGVGMASLDHADIATAIAATYPAAERMLASEDAVEGPRAFAAKRKPVWRGR